MTTSEHKISFPPNLRSYRAKCSCGWAAARQTPGAVEAAADMHVSEYQEHCAICYAGPDVPGGLKLTADLETWVCRRDQACLKRAPAFPATLESTNPVSRAQAIDLDYRRRGQ
jgi:hypothetical protein